LLEHPGKLIEGSLTERRYRSNAGESTKFENLIIRDAYPRTMPRIPSTSPIEVEWLDCDVGVGRNQHLVGMEVAFETVDYRDTRGWALSR
jgi:hypothetical protein